jgi:hypothetical protein
MARKKTIVDDGSPKDIDDTTFDSICAAIVKNKDNLDRAKIKYAQWTEQNDYILENHAISRKDFVFALNKRAGVHNRAERKPEPKAK